MSVGRCSSHASIWITNRQIVSTIEKTFARLLLEVIYWHVHPSHFQNLQSDKRQLLSLTKSAEMPSSKLDSNARLELIQYLHS
jgi:hypothetical protein